MTRDSHLQSKNWFRQLFEVAHHLSNSWPSYIRWHAFWLEYIFLKILNQTWSSPALQRCSIIRLPLPLTDWLPVDHTHFSRHLLIPIWQMKGQTYFFETYLVTMPMILSNGRPSIFLLLGSPKSLAQNPVLANEELALAPLISHRLQLVVPHVLNLVNHSE